MKKDTRKTLIVGGEEFLNANIAKPESPEILAKIDEMYANTRIEAEPIKVITPYVAQTHSISNQISKSVARGRIDKGDGFHVAKVMIAAREFAKQIRSEVDAVITDISDTWEAARRKEKHGYVADASKYSEGVEA